MLANRFTVHWSSRGAYRIGSGRAKAHKKLRKLSGAQTVKKAMESSRGPQTSRTTIAPGGVYGGRVPFGRDVCAQVDHLKARALQHHRDEVFAYVVQGALYRADCDLAHHLHMVGYHKRLYYVHARLRRARRLAPRARIPRCS